MAPCAAGAASSTSTTLRRSWESCPRAAASASRSSCYCAALGSALADLSRNSHAHLTNVQLPGHASGLVTVDRAIERVLAGLQRHGDSGLPALTDHRALSADSALDRDVVLQRRRIGHGDRDLAGFGAELGRVELQLRLVGLQ